MKSFLLIATLSFCLLTSGLAQTGITIGPPRVYFTIGPGQSQTERVLVSNPSKDYALELGVSFEDWEYSPGGDNVMHPAGTLPTSCAPWVSVPQSFFSLAPGETKELLVQMNIPAEFKNDTIPAHTCMLYVSQLNPRDGVDKDGASIRIAVRSGIKLYQRKPGSVRPELEISNFQYRKTDEPALILSFDNIGRIWADGSMSTEIVSQSTGSVTQLPDAVFYSMPADKRQQTLLLPSTLAPGKYTATTLINYGDADTVKLAELEFTHENP
jgi:P pilus assembly chaperone PapD